VNERRGEEPAVLALVGLRCSGKSTVGRALAARTGARFVDLDEAVAAAAGAASAAEVIEARGLEAFRDLEEATLAGVLESATEPTVLATGGGTVERQASRERLRSRARVVWLRAPLAELRARMEADRSTDRPRITDGDEDEFIFLERRRAPHFEALADEVVEVAGRAPDDLAAALDGTWPR
jgi:shikimate kinase